MILFSFIILETMFLENNYFVEQIKG